MNHSVKGSRLIDPGLATKYDVVINKAAPEIAN